jgi:hypothetical protein
VPGTWTFTYWPGRKGIATGSVTRSRKLVSDSASTPATVAATLCASVLQASDEAGTAMTQSDFGIIWQVSTMPAAASSSVIASSR